MGIGVFLQDIVALSDANQTLDLDLYVVARWRDARLSDPSRGAASAECPVAAGQLWVPQLEPEGLRSRQLFYPDRFLVNGDGIVTWTRRMWVTVSYPLDFHDFPFDRHQWRTTAWPVALRVDELTFVPLERMSGRSERLSIQGWRVGTPRVVAGTAVRDQRGGTFARLDVNVELVRDWSYYAWKLGLPLMLIVLMAYGVYFIPATAVPQQIGLGTSAMLTLIAYMLTLNATLPRISYLTRADRFFVGSAVLVFVGLFKALATLASGPDAKTRFVEFADRRGRWLFPVAMVANLLIALLW